MIWLIFHLGFFERGFPWIVADLVACAFFSYTTCQTFSYVAHLLYIHHRGTEVSLANSDPRIAKLSSTAVFIDMHVVRCRAGQPEVCALRHIKTLAL